MALVADPTISKLAKKSTVTTTEIKLPYHRLQRKRLAEKLQDLPLLENVNSQSLINDLIFNKINLCTVLFPVFIEEKDIQLDEPSIHMVHTHENIIPDPYDNEKRIKINTLIELSDYFNEYPSLMITHIIPLFEMISANIFRPFRPFSHEIGEFDPYEDEQQQEPEWSHLQFVYQILEQVLNFQEFESKINIYITHDFIDNLILLFDSEDIDERAAVKAVVHRIYSKTLKLRQYIRKTLCNSLYNFVNDKSNFNGVSEVLEIFGSIITGFALPLRPEHIVLFNKVLLPLHKPEILPLYHPSLSYCVIQFLDKDSLLAPSALNCLLKFWPLTSRKQVLFLNELEEIFEKMSVTDFNDTLIKAVAKRLGDCLSSNHLQVAERSLLLFNNEHVLNCFYAFKSITFVQLNNAINKARSHWSPQIVQIASRYSGTFDLI